MTFIEEARLFPETFNQGGAAAHSPQRPARKAAQFPEILRTQVRHFMVFEMSPDVLSRVQLRCVAGQKLQHDPSLLRTYKVPDHPAAMLAQPIPDNQQPARDVPQEVFQKLHDLGLRMVPGNRRK